MKMNKEQKEYNSNKIVKELEMEKSREIERGWKSWEELKGIKKLYEESNEKWIWKKAVQ